MTSQGANQSILMTWSLSFDHLRAQREDAANLLLLWAFLDNQDLWYELLAPALNKEIVGGLEIPDWFAKCASDEIDFKECMRLLLDYSFIDVKTGSSSFSIHPVFHHWFSHAFEEEIAITMGRLALIIVTSATPSETMPYYSLIQRRFLLHCDRIINSLAQQYTIQESLIDERDLRWRSKPYNKLETLYSDQGRMKEAEDMSLRAMAGNEEASGAEHTLTFDTSNPGKSVQVSRQDERSQRYVLASIDRIRKGPGS